MRSLYIILISLSLSGVAMAAPKGWVCDASGCRPAPKAAATVRSGRMVERKGLLARLFPRLASRVQGRLGR